MGDEFGAFSWKDMESMIGGVFLDTYLIWILSHPLGGCMSLVGPGRD